MNLRNAVTLSALALFGVALPTLSSAQTDIARWSFSAAVASPYNNPTASTDVTGGTAMASALGMTNNYTYANGTMGAVTNCDVVSTVTTGSPSPDPASHGYAWRVRGANPNNGWNLAAPQYTQGVEFDISTIGFTNISFSYDWFSTTQGVRNLQIQYNLDTTNAAGWTNIGTLRVAMPNVYSPTDTIDLSAIAGTANNPHLGVRLVSAYDPTYTGSDGPTYTAATLVAGAPVKYNNSSGNWRFDQIAFRGIPAATLSGTLTLQGIVTSAPAQPLTFTLHPSDNSGDMVKTASVSPNGAFQLTGVPRKNYSLRIKGDRYLSTTVSNVDASGGDVSGITAALKAGDANNDNAVDISDLLILIAHYNQVSPAAGYLAAADFNLDGVNDIADLLLLISNYNQLGG